MDLLVSMEEEQEARVWIRHTAGAEIWAKLKGASLDQLLAWQAEMMVAWLRVPEGTLLFYAVQLVIEDLELEITGRQRSGEDNLMGGKEGSNGS